MNLRMILIAALSALLSCSSFADTPAPTTSSASADFPDFPEDDTPIPPPQPRILNDYNHFMYNINSTLDDYFAKPVATFYVKVMPRPLNNMVRNFLSNLGEVPIIGNDVLQADFYHFSQDSWRMAVNSTVGIGGLYNPANRAQLYQHENDFGLTLARWGWRNSQYFVIPVLGPSTIRDTWGQLGTLYMSVYPYIHNYKISEALYLIYLLNRRAQALQYENLMDNAALDRYIFLENAYLQNRNYQIQQMLDAPTAYTAGDTQQYARSNYLYQ